MAGNEGPPVTSHIEVPPPPAIYGTTYFRPAEITPDAQVCDDGTVLVTLKAPGSSVSSSWVGTHDEAINLCARIAAAVSDSEEPRFVFDDISPHPERPEPQVVCVPRKMGGKPCFVGTRTPLEAVLSYKRRGASDEAVLEAYPHLTVEHLAAANEFYVEELSAGRPGDTQLAKDAEQ